ncbi:MAG: alpha-glucan phosphorylase [Bacteroides sp. SM23_62_1]|nr:MAG: alpha-glucan phosphorylase [Bacteroides sp. SM23_62_1]
MERNKLVPDYLFEVSWEVCNKVGGIHTVLSTKAKTLRADLDDRHILIGPDVWRDSEANPEFEEDTNLYREWKRKALEEGIRIRIGRWKISSRPVAILLDFTTYISRKDEIFSKLWESFKLDSISGQWDYIEPALFGYAAGNVINSFINFNLNPRTSIVAHFHEWMTGAGLLYLKEYVPQVATVFTTHATVIGRSIAGNQLPLYSRLDQYDGDVKSNDFNVVSKQSLEKLAAQNADAFTTVSEITARECTQFLKKEVDIITPNGFDDSFVPQGDDFIRKSQEARELLRNVSETILGYRLKNEPLMVATSGRYEFRNKGLDVFIDALGELNTQDLTREIIAYIWIPAHHYGPRKDLLEALESGNLLDANASCQTHYLHNPENDPIIKGIIKQGLDNSLSTKVKVIFVPSYLQGSDGIFNKSYYDLLIGMDITVFPSYYEPWGYTPLESLAFHIPTITTSLAGFGLWVRKNYQKPENGITIIERDDQNFDTAATFIMKSLLDYSRLSPDQTEKARQSAYDISRMALWTNFIEYYKIAYDTALYISKHRTNLYFDTGKPEVATAQVISSKPEWKTFVVEENIPEKLKALEDLSRNLWWSWNHNAMELFSSIDEDLWEESNRNPIIFLQKIPLAQLQKLEKDREFLKRLDRITSEFHAYMAAGEKKERPKIAYFSMEFGLHDSLRIYSGGLGVLAGDYLKEASDSNRDLVGIGLLYKYGYFTQVVSASGEQIVSDDPQDFSSTPAQPVRNTKGKWKTITIKLPGRNLLARIWKVNVGRIELYLLDTDFEENIEQDRTITHFLYGGDDDNRFKQELLLGVGGIRALHVLNIIPDLYHSNEGHSAFIGLERLREIIQKNNLKFQEALEVVRASTLFTTHTPVPAGHDTFDEGLVRTYLAHYPDRLGITWNHMIQLGKLNPDDKNERFSMSYLAINLSQEVNGVSRLHGTVAQKMFSDIWKGYTADELYIGYVTNGVHVPTWMARGWIDLYTARLDEEFIMKQYEKDTWGKIYKVPDQYIWDLRNQQREKLIGFIKSSLKNAMVKRLENPRIIMEAEEKFRGDILTIGFARRFATYKRAYLLFRDPERLASIVNHSDRPVQFVFAGKAHPRDKAGQDLIRMVVEMSKRPEFTGRIIFLQNYDISLAQKLVQGMDIWLNTPTRPLEASGTSGQKVIMNGGLHFSVLDGWWAEGYVEGAGWAIPEERTYDSQDYQDELDAETIYTLLEDEIAPAFYTRNDDGIPERWIQFIKKSIAEIAPNFTMNRMLMDYEQKYYLKLFERSVKMRANDYQLATEITKWKKQITHAWNNIMILSFQHPDISRTSVTLGNAYNAEVTIDLNGLSPDEIGVEVVIRNFGPGDQCIKQTCSIELKMQSIINGTALYSGAITPVKPGVFEYGIRIFPKHKDLPHRQDFALVKWV